MREGIIYFDLDSMIGCIRLTPARAALSFQRLRTRTSIDREGSSNDVASRLQPVSGPAVRTCPAQFRGPANAGYLHRNSYYTHFAFAIKSPSITSLMTGFHFDCGRAGELVDDCRFRVITSPDFHGCSCRSS